MPSFLSRYDEPHTVFVLREYGERQVKEENEARAAAATPGDPVPVPEVYEASPDDDVWWVKYRTSLTGKQRDSLRSRFQTIRTLPNGRVILEVTDPVANVREQGLMAIHSWNLTDENDEVLPFEHDWEAELKAGAPPSPLRVSWNRLPMHIQDVILVVIQEADAEPMPAKDGRFPDGRNGSTPDENHEGSVHRESVG